MKVFNIDYIAAEGVSPSIIAVKGHPTEEGAAKSALQEGAQRLQARESSDLRTFGDPLALALFNHFAKVKVEVLPDDADIAIWDMISPARKPRNKSSKTEDSGLQPGQEATMSTGPEGNLPTNQEGQNEMVTATETTTGGKAKRATTKGKAKAKKAAKKNGAAKATKAASDGLPREGTKAAKLLAMICRDGGATFAEMQKMTGWKEMRGTALTLARRAGLQLRAISDKEGKKATRWHATKE